MFKIFFAAVIIEVLQRFAGDPVIASDLMYLNDAPKGKDGSPRQGGGFEIVWQMVWGMLQADDMGVASTSPRGLASVMDVIVVICQVFGLTVTIRTQDSGILHTAYCKLLLRVIGFRCKDRSGYKHLSYGEALERAGSQCIEMTIRKRQVGFAGALVLQGESRLSNRIMYRWLAVQGSKRGGRPATSWGDCPPKHLEAFGAIPR